MLPFTLMILVLTFYLELCLSAVHFAANYFLSTVMTREKKLWQRENVENIFFANVARQQPKTWNKTQKHELITPALFAQAGAKNTHICHIKICRANWIDGGKTHTHTHHTTVPYIHYLYLNNEIALCVINMISTFKMLFIHPLIILCQKWKHLSVCTNVMFLYVRKRDTNIDFYHRHHHFFSIIYMNDSVNREKWRVWARKNRNYGGKAGGEGGGWREA